MNTLEIDDQQVNAFYGAPAIVSAKIIRESYELVKGSCGRYNR